MNMSNHSAFSGGVLRGNKGSKYAGKKRRQSSGYKGVTFDKNQGKWKAYRSVKECGKSKTKHLGYFSDEEDAAAAVAAASSYPGTACGG